jgi:hypothetical protein
MLRIGLILLIAPCLLLMALYVPEQLSAADCVNSGGSFDYAEQLCDQQNKHPQSSFMARNTMFVNTSMLLAVLGFFVCLINLYTPKKPN